MGEPGYYTSRLHKVPGTVSALGSFSRIPDQDYHQDCATAMCWVTQRNKMVGVEEDRTFRLPSGAKNLCVKSYQLPAKNTTFLPVMMP